MVDTHNSNQSKLCILLLVALTFCLISPHVLAQSNTKIVEQFVDAFNQKNIEAMLNFSASNMQWMRVSGKDLSVETSSQEQLRKAMVGYFKSVPSAKSKIRSIKESGAFVYALEEASWLSKGIKKSQCSMAVYELNENKIQNVWYFQEHTC